MRINFNKYSGNTTTQKHKNLCGSTKKKSSFFLFTHCSLPHCISLTIFSCSLYFSILFSLLSHFSFLVCLLSLMQFFKTALSSISLTETSLHSSLLHQMAEWHSFYFFIFFFFSSFHTLDINSQ